MKRRLISALCLLLFACDSVVRRVVTLTFDAPAERVIIAATTYVGTSKPGTVEFAEGEEERSALLAERDEWSLRFAQATPEAERVTFERTHGKIDSVERRATVAVDQLQRFFFDTPITVTTTRGEGWMEMTIYAGASMRATTAQRRQAERILATYSARAAHYFEAVRSMYLYLDEKPQRAQELFTDVFSEEEERRLLSNNERSITDAVRQTAGALFDTSNIDAGASVDRIFDLVHNPFPAKFRVVIRGAALAVEGFHRVDSETYEIKMPTAVEAVGELEGRWISPDPLALASRPDLEKKNAAELASMIFDAPRRADPVVTRSEVEAAIVERMRPAPRYRLRWVTKPQSPAS